VDNEFNYSHPLFVKWDRVIPQLNPDSLWNWTNIQKSVRQIRLDPRDPSNFLHMTVTVRR